MFKVGQSVSVLDEDLTGEVIAVKGDVITVSCDGFDLEFSADELVLIDDALGQSYITPDQEDINQKAQPKKRQTTRKKKAKDKYSPTMEVDLHIHQLTDKSGRMTNHEMLNLQVDTARRQLEFAIRKRFQKIVFIHGVGEGVLKMELEYLFGRYNVKYYDADYKKYGLGATEVYIYQNATPD
ncbi:DNA mismatch repair protein MutS [Mangrovimonas cancribranchiae]|uniref:DNA mismatch repair protein MutS n=1 Tax=Mangrovimonas cancribranchiae TaxID=3080055 RepID=A0AAU6P4K4_9FLAO